MSKFYIVAFILAFSGCSHFKFNASMCNQIASEPNSVIPQECKNYNEEEANKAFFNEKNTTQSSDGEIIEFHKK